MEDTEDEDLTLSPPHPHCLQILQSTSPSVGVWLGLGLGLGLFSFLRYANPPKPFSVAIKVADGALKGTKILTKLQSPSNLDAFLLASKALDNGYKASKRLRLMRSTDSTAVSSFTKKLKPYVGAVNLFRHTRSIISDNGAFGFGIVSYGYKVSKNFFKVLEGFVGFELDDAVKKGLESVGLVLKAVKVVREIRVITSGGVCRNNCFLRKPWRSEV